MKFGVVFKLHGPLSEAVAVEWTEVAAPLDSGSGWEPCIRRPDGSWQLFSADPAATGPYLRDPGLLRDVGLRYRLAAAGPWSPISADRKEITIVDPAIVPPVLRSEPTLAGTGVIGTEVTVDPGVWDGSPTPTVALQWLRDGAEIAGATAAAYRPGSEDDRCLLACAVTAGNTGGSERVVTAGLAVRYAPPEATGALPEEIFDEGTGIQVVEAAPAFTGEDLTFTVEGAGATVDPRSGRISIPTDAPVSATVTVAAENSGGSAKLDFQVTVEPIEDTVEISLIGPSNAELVLLPDLDPDASGLHLGLRITDPSHPLHPAQGGVGYLAWTGASTEGRDPVTQANKAVRARDFSTKDHANYGVWALTRKTNGGLADWADRTSEIGGTITVTVNCSGDADTVPLEQALWLGWGPTFPAWTLATADRGVPADPGAEATGSRRMPFQSEAEWIASQKEGYIAGDGMQQIMCMVQSRKNPNYLVKVQDVGGPWVSLDHGASWWKPRCKGQRSPLTNSVGLDPADDNHWFILCHGGFAGVAQHQGLYRTTDGGATMTRVFETVDFAGRLTPDSLIAASPSSVAGGRAQRWYSIFNQVEKANNLVGGIYFIRSNDGGATWSQVGSLLSLSTYGLINHVVVHPTDQNTLFFASDSGLWKIANAGGTPSISKIGVGISSGFNRIALCEMVGGKLHIVVGNGNGIRKSTDGGTTWSAPSYSKSVEKLYVNPWNHNQLASIGGSSAPRPDIYNGSGWKMAPGSAFPGRPGFSTYNETPCNTRQSHLAFHPTSGQVYVKCKAVTPNNVDYRSSNAMNGSGGNWTISNGYFSGTHSDVILSSGQGFASALVFGVGIIDAAVCMSQDGGRSWRRPSITGSDLTRLGIGHRSCSAFAVHPQWPSKPYILTIMDVATKGKFVMCNSENIESGSNWIRPSGIESGSTKCRFVGFDISSPQYAYAIRSKSTNHGASWSVMGSMPSGFLMWGMTREAVAAQKLSSGEALFAYDEEGTQQKVARSLDRGESWTIVLDFGAKLLNQVGKAAGGAFLPHPTNHNRLFVRGGGTSARLYRLDEGSGTNRPYSEIFNLNDHPNIRNALVSPDAFSVDHIAVDPRYPDNIWYITNEAAGSGVPMIRTTDGGKTWENLAGLVSDNGLTFTDVSPFTGDVIQTSPNGAFVIAPPYKHFQRLYDMVDHPNRIMG